MRRACQQVGKMFVLLFFPNVAPPKDLGTASPSFLTFGNFLYGKQSLESARPPGYRWGITRL